MDAEAAAQEVFVRGGLTPSTHSDDVVARIYMPTVSFPKPPGFPIDLPCPNPEVTSALFIPSSQEPFSASSVFETWWDKNHLGLVGINVTFGTTRRTFGRRGDGTVDDALRFDLLRIPEGDWIDSLVLHFGGPILPNDDPAEKSVVRGINARVSFAPGLASVRLMPSFAASDACSFLSMMGVIMKRPTPKKLREAAQKAINEPMRRGPPRETAQCQAEMRAEAEEECAASLDEVTRRLDFMLKELAIRGEEE
ncbi:hypothetical protein B0H63DRAFT_556192 [Podospora didyma]|uniref:Uncharacterized protein n=1 Tax=Podospora didyma TaxID=330526 RepID=A0AAE0U8P1_9PEZI|nr:hypothetical protein B0H63DRAFT_556192 [Podospora didyma]